MEAPARNAPVRNHPATENKPTPASTVITASNTALAKRRRCRASQGRSNLSALKNLSPAVDDVYAAHFCGDVGIMRGQIGRASCRERVCQSGEVQWVAGSLKKKKKNK